MLQCFKEPCPSKYPSHTSVYKLNSIIMHNIVSLSVRLNDSAAISSKSILQISCSLLVWRYWVVKDSAISLIALEGCDPLRIDQENNSNDDSSSIEPLTSGNTVATAALRAIN